MELILTYLFLTYLFSIVAICMLVEWWRNRGVAVKTCPRCQGTGRIKNDDPTGDPRVRPYCPVCGGSGQVKMCPELSCILQEGHPGQHCDYEGASWDTGQNDVRGSK